MRAWPSSTIFWHWTSKNIPVPVFKNWKKCHITPPYCACATLLKSCLGALAKTCLTHWHNGHTTPPGSRILLGQVFVASKSALRCVIVYLLRTNKTNVEFVCKVPCVFLSMLFPWKMSRKNKNKHGDFVCKVPCFLELKVYLHKILEIYFCCRL